MPSIMMSSKMADNIMTSSPEGQSHIISNDVFITSPMHSVEGERSSPDIRDLSDNFINPPEHIGGIGNGGFNLNEITTSSAIENLCFITSNSTSSYQNATLNCNSSEQLIFSPSGIFETNNTTGETPKFTFIHLVDYLVFLPTPPLLLSHYESYFSISLFFCHPDPISIPCLLIRWHLFRCIS